MKKEHKLILTFLILGLLVTSLSVSLVSAANPLTDSLRSFYDKWASGEGLSNGVTKIFLGIIIFLLVTVGLEFTPGLKDKKAIIMIIAGAVAIIATAYFTPEEVIAIVTSYTALGLTLTALIPFLVVAGFTFTAVRNNDAVMMVMSQIAWGFFALFSLYRFWTLVYSNRLGIAETLADNPVAIIILATTILSALIFIFSKQIRRSLARMIIEAEIEAAKKGGKEATAEIKILREMLGDQSRASF